MPCWESVQVRKGIFRLAVSILVGLIVFFLITTSPTFAQCDISNIDPDTFRLDHCIAEILTDLATFLITISPGVIVIFLAIGGIKYMSSAGDERALASARRFITLTILGSVVILGVVAIFRFILGYFLGLAGW